jgi:hypothetical protein
MVPTHRENPLKKHIYCGIDKVPKSSPFLYSPISIILLLLLLLLLIL